MSGDLLYEINDALGVVFGMFSDGFSEDEYDERLNDATHAAFAAFMRKEVQ